MEPRCYQCNTLLGDINAACPNCLPNWNRAYAPEVPQPDAPVSWEEQRYLDAQATIAALQARVKELEEWKRIVTGAGTDQESVIRLAAHEYTKIAVQCWKEANAKLESQLTQRTAECDALKLVNDTHMKTVMKLSHVVEQRTAELEAAKAIQAIDMKNNNAYREQVANLQAELEAVKQQLSAAQETILRTYTASAALDLVGVKAKLERVRGELAEAAHNVNVYQSLYSTSCMDRALLENELRDLRTLVLALPKVEGEISEIICDVWIDDARKSECLPALAALLQHRQGMEG